MPNIKLLDSVGTPVIYEDIETVVLYDEADEPVIFENNSTPGPSSPEIKVTETMTGVSIKVDSSPIVPGNFISAVFISIPQEAVTITSTVSHSSLIKKDTVFSLYKSLNILLSKNISIDLGLLKSFNIPKDLLHDITKVTLIPAGGTFGTNIIEDTYLSGIFTRVPIRTIRPKIQIVIGKAYIDYDIISTSNKDLYEFVETMSTSAGRFEMLETFTVKTSAIQLDVGAAKEIALKKYLYHTITSIGMSGG